MLMLYAGRVRLVDSICEETAKVFFVIIFIRVVTIKFSITLKVINC